VFGGHEPPPVRDAEVEHLRHASVRQRCAPLGLEPDRITEASVAHPSPAEVPDHDRFLEALDSDELGKVRFTPLDFV
jgi:hypothetical protein